VYATKQDPTTASGPRADGRSVRWDSHRSRRRTDLLEVTRHLIHAKGPDVTMAEIARASGTSKSVLYRYFPDKDRLQQAVGRHILSAMHRTLLEELAALERAGRKDDVQVAADQRIRVMIGTYVNTARRSPNVYAFVTRPGPGLNHFLETITRLVTRIAPATIPDREIWAAGAVGFVQGSVDRWMRTDPGPAASTGPGDSTGTTDPAVGTGSTVSAVSTSPGSPSAECLTDHLVHWLMTGAL
jgi:AcrR family transcriptional regulator